MKYGTVLAVADPRPIPELAQAAEDAGWDAVFLADPVWGVAPWVTLAACASVTERIRLGTMLTPPSAWRPWKLAAEVATLDNLSEGRAILSVGLGATDAGFDNVGEETDRRVRAQLLDEGLDVITGLWSGRPFGYEGRHYTVTPIDFPPPPPPVQQPRVPIWCVGAWGYRKSMDRALRYDGLLPNVPSDGGMRTATLDEVEEMAALIRERKGCEPYELIIEGGSPGDDRIKAAEHVAPWADAGATWWVESQWDGFGTDEGLAQLRARVDAGPPQA